MTKKHISLEEGRKLAVQIFDRPRPEPQKLSNEERERLVKIRKKISELKDQLLKGKIAKNDQSTANS